MFLLTRISIRDGKPRQRLLWLLLVIVTFALTGVIVGPPAGPQRAERFPCEHCSCGCPSAEYCWDQCCCYSDQQKLRWAEKSGVTPPEFLIARVAKSSEMVAASNSRTCCCASESASDCSSPATEDATVEASVGRTDRVAAILMWKAAKCHGIKQIWSLLAAVYVGGNDTLCGNTPPCLEWITIVDRLGISRPRLPDPPVP